MIKKLTIKEAVALEKEHSFLGEFLSVFPNNLGINLCAIESIEFECEDDEFGQLTDLHIKFIPDHSENYTESIKANGGTHPWLHRDENGEVVL